MKRHKKIYKKTKALILTVAMLASLLAVPVNAQTETVQLLSNGSFESSDEYDFPVSWSSNGENLIPNGDFESRYYWTYENAKGPMSYEYDDELKSTVGKLEWRDTSWNGISMRTDRYGYYFDYEQEGQIKDLTQTKFAGIPIEWGGSYIPRMKAKYEGDLQHLRMNVTFGSANNGAVRGSAPAVINASTSGVPQSTWVDLGGKAYTVPTATVASAAEGISYDETAPGIIKLIMVGRSQGNSSSSDYTKMFTWTDDARFEKIGRTSTMAASIGAKSLMVRGYADGITEEWKSDSVSVRAGEALDVKSKVRVDEVASYTRNGVAVLPEVAVSVKFDNGTVTKIGSIADVTDGFTEIAGEVFVPQDASTAQLVYTFDGKGTAYFDDAQINAQREVQDVDTNAYFNRLLNGGFESVDSKGFPASWDSNGKNLIPNGDFESNSLVAGAGINSGITRSYTKAGGVSSVEISENEADAPEELGAYSLKMTWNKVYWGGTEVRDDSAILPLSYNSDYIMRAWVKAGKNEDFPEATNKFQFNIVASYASRDIILDNNSWVPTTEWQEFKGTFSTPEKPSDVGDGFPFAKRYQLRSRTSATEDAVMYVDNFRMEKLGRCDTENSATGNKSLKIVAYDDGIDEVWTSDRVSVRENQEIAIGASYKTESLDGGVCIAANFYKNDSAVGSAVLADGAESATWEKAVKTVTVPAGADNAEIVISVAGASGNAWVDDVLLGEKAGTPFISSIDYSVDDLYGNGGENVEIDVNISNYNEACSAFVATALYDGEDNLIAIDCDSEEIAQNATNQTVIRNITLPEGKDLADYKLKTFLWNSTDAMLPYCSPETFPSTESTFTVNKVFQNNMVLQRDEKIAVYGEGTPGEPITVSLGEDTAVARTDSRGDWIAYLPPRSASTDGITLTVSGRGGREFSFDNILIGDVFIMSGQSNAAFSISEVSAFRAKPDEANDSIRVLGMYEASNNDRLGSQTEQKNLPTAEDLNPLGNNGVTDPAWLEFKPCSTDREIRNDPLTRDTSAVLYYFAKTLQQELKASTGETVPMGLITAAVGGSRIEKWLPSEVYEQNRDLTADQTALKSTLYNNMINPLTKFKVKGILWYQGCANATNSVRYKREMRFLIESWRNRFKNENLPFIIHQLAGFADQYGLIRDSQKSVADSMDNVELNVLIDLGEKNNIHPQAKEPAGIRDAYIALREWYGIENTDGLFADFDRYEPVEYNGNQAMKLYFKNVTGGFYTVDSNGVRTENPQPDGFLIADSQGEFKHAQAVLNEDNTITVWSEEVANPVYVRYAFEGFPYPEFANLYTENGLPLTPFRNDTINVEYSLERVNSDNMVLDGDFETVAADGKTFTGYYTHRVTNTSYGGVTVGQWDTVTDKYGKYYADMSVFNGTGNANTQVYTAVTGARENGRLPIYEGTYIIEADVEANFTDASTQLYIQGGIYNNNEVSVGSFYTNNGDWLLTESTDGMVHIKGTVTFDSTYNNCYIYAFGPRLVTKSSDVQNVKIDNLVFRRAD